MPRKPTGVIKFDLKCACCGESIPKEHGVYTNSYPQYARAKKRGGVFCSKSCGTKFRHANLTPKQKKAYHNKIANTRKSRSSEENAKSVEKLRNTWAEKSEEEREDIKARTLATKEERGNKNTWVKAKRTMIRKMGADYGKQRAAKAEETMLREYGIRNALVDGSEFREKAKQTSLSVYGHKVASSSPWIKAKIVETTTRKYGGMGRASESSNAKYESTMRSEYSVDNPMKHPRFKKKCAKSYKEGGGKYKAQATKERNGTDPKEVALKGHETKKKNGSYRTNKQEEYILQRLRSLLGKQVVHLHRNHPDYPWEADFYDPKTGTIYEYQGYFTHGKEPYDPQSKEHRKIVRELKAKAKSDKWAAKLTLEVWTRLDPLKRATAQANGVPFVEWFDLKEFEKWLVGKIKKLLRAVKVKDNCYKLKDGTYVAYITSGYVGTDKCDKMFYPDTDLRKLSKSFKGVK